MPWWPEGALSRQPPRGHPSRWVGRKVLGIGLLTAAVVAAGIGVAALTRPARPAPAASAGWWPGVIASAVQRPSPSRPALPVPSVSAAPKTTAPLLAQTVTNRDARLAYDVPAGWTIVGDAREPNSLDIPFSGVATTSYTCGGTVYRAGIAASGAAQAAAGTVTPTQAAEVFAKTWSADLYPHATVRLEPVKSTTTGAVEIDATVTAAGGDPCAPTSALVAVLAWPVPGGATACMVTGATAGPAELHPVDPQTITAVADSARLLPPNH